MKESLIKRIQETSNSELLKEACRLLEIDFDDQEVYNLSNEQEEAIKEKDIVRYNKSLESFATHLQEAKYYCDKHPE